MERFDWLAFDEKGPHQERLKKELAKVQDALEGAGEGALRLMVRADFCAPAEVKYRLGKGKPDWDPEMLDFLCGDMRMYDLLEQYPRLLVPVWTRPWVDAKVEDGYPVEYRTFVQDGELIGVSSYYPQRPLRRDDAEIEAVSVYSYELARLLRDRTPFEFAVGNAMQEMIDWRQGKKTPDRNECSFTADFLIEKHSGEAIFLEGGPPHHRGAHMCCFKEGEIEGVALVDRNVEAAVS